jgi:hypothetical protein
MTKLREPMSFERALDTIKTLIGWDGCASVLNKTESAVRKMSDPDIERTISIRDARRLDQAYRRAGGAGAPMLETYASQLDMGDSDGVAAPDVILTAIRASVKECGEAVAAALEAVNGGASRQNRVDALREIEEGIESLMDLARKFGAQQVIEGG